MVLRPGTGKRGRRLGPGLVLGLLGGVVAAVTLTTASSPPARAAARECQQARITAEPAPGIRGIRLKPTSDGTELLIFGTTRTPREVELRGALVDSPVPAPGTDVAFTVSRLARGDGVDIPLDQVRALGCVARDGQHVAVDVRVDPRSAPPGTYTGTVEVNDASFDSTSTPFTITIVLQDPRWYAALLIVVLSALAATVAQRFIRLVETGRLRVDGGASGHPRAGRGPRSLAGGWDTVGGTIVGLAGALGLYVDQFAGDPAWTLDTTHAWKLAVAAFTAAFTGYAGAVTLLRARSKGGTEVDR